MSSIPEKFDNLIEQWKSGKFHKILTIAGAGMSTAAGIPDFRSPKTGLFATSKKLYKVKNPHDLLDFNYFRKDPKPFFAFAKDSLYGEHKPTAAHHFIEGLHEHGMLLRHYTQNIDGLERLAGVPSDKLVEAHGTVSLSHCVQCERPFTMEWTKTRVLSGEIPKCTECSGVVKPDVVLYHEDLPSRFYNLLKEDAATCDMIIILGTSLRVEPFKSLLTTPQPPCPRLLINRTLIDAFRTKSPRNFFYRGDCDDGVMLLANRLGWSAEITSKMMQQANQL